MSIRRCLAAVFVPLYTLVVAVLILIFSGSPYAFMIDEMDLGNKISFCDLPKPMDDVSDITIPMTGILVLGLLLAGAISSYRKRRVRLSLILGCVLTLFWVYRSFLQNIGC